MLYSSGVCLKTMIALVILYGVDIQAIMTNYRQDSAKSLRWWKLFISDFIKEKLFTGITLISDSTDKEWVQWERNIATHLFRGSKSVNSVVLEVAGGNTSNSYDEDSYATLKKYSKVMYVAPFWTAKHAGFISKMFIASSMKHSPILLIAKPNFESKLTSVLFPHMNLATIAVYEENVINLLEVYQIDKLSSHIVVPSGNWTVMEPLFSGNHTSQLFVADGDVISRRLDLQGKRIRCVTVDNPPFTIVKKDADNRLILDGWVHDIWRLIEELSNITTECYYSPDGQFGVRLATGWTGMVKELVDDNADVVVATLDQNTRRKEFVDFSAGLVIYGYVMVIQRPLTTNAVWSSLVMQMTPMAWFGYGLSLLVFFFLFRFFGKFSKNEVMPVTFSESFMTIVYSVTAKGETAEFQSTPVRLLLVSLHWLNTMVMVYYTNFLTAILTVTTGTPPFTTLEGLLAYGSYDFGLLKGISPVNQMEISDIPLYRKVWETFLMNPAKPLPLSDQEGMERVKKTRYVYMIDDLNFKANFAKDCDLYMIPKRYLEIPSSFGVQKGSTLRNIIDYHLLQLSESGIINKLWRKYNFQTQDCSSAGGKTPMSLWNMVTAFLMLGFFAFVSFAILACEIHRERRKKKKKPQEVTPVLWIGK